MEQAAGKVREETREAIDNTEMQAKGKAQQVEGKLKETKGKAKDAVD